MDGYMNGVVEADVGLYTREETRGRFHEGRAQNVFNLGGHVLVGRVLGDQALILLSQVAVVRLEALQLFAETVDKSLGLSDVIGFCLP